jgi:hypothetical protein
MPQRLIDETGITMTDLLLGMMLSVVTVALISSALVLASRIEVHTSEDSQALAALRHSTERLGKELRNAQVIYSDSGPRRVHFWTDSQQPGQEGHGEASPDERVTWELQAAADRARLVRYTDADTAAGTLPSPWVQDLVLEDLFRYRRGTTWVDATPFQATIVALSFRADAAPGKRAEPKLVQTEVRLRNVA